MAVAGVLALLVALAAAFYAKAAGREAARLAASAGASCASLTPASGRVSLAGRAEPGPHGLLRAPLSGTGCVWYRAAVTERWSELDRSLVRDFDRDGYLDRSEADAATREHRRTQTDVSSHPFRLRDATGSVLVDPRGMTADRLRESVRSTGGPDIRGYFPDNTVPIERAGFGVGRASGRGQSRFDRTETVLTPGEQIFVTGTVVRHPDGGLAIGGGKLVVSTRGPVDLSYGQTAKARLAWVVAVLAAATGIVLVLTG